MKDDKSRRTGQWPLPLTPPSPGVPALKAQRLTSKTRAPDDTLLYYVGASRGCYHRLAKNTLGLGAAPLLRSYFRRRCGSPSFPFPPSPASPSSDGDPGAQSVVQFVRARLYFRKEGRLNLVIAARDFGTAGMELNSLGLITLTMFLATIITVSRPYGDWQDV